MHDGERNTEVITLVKGKFINKYDLHVVCGYVLREGWRTVARVSKLWNLQCN